MIVTRKPTPVAGFDPKDWTNQAGVITEFDAADWTDANSLGAAAALTGFSVDDNGHLVLDVPQDATNKTGLFYDTATGTGDFYAAFRVSIQAALQADANLNQNWEVLCGFAGGGAPVDFSTDKWAAAGIGVAGLQHDSIAVYCREGNGTDFNTNSVNYQRTGVPTLDFDLFIFRDESGQELIFYYSPAHSGSYIRAFDTAANADYAATGQLGFRIFQNTAADSFKVVLKAFAPPGVLTQLP